METINQDLNTSKINSKIAKFIGLEDVSAHITDKYGYHQCEEGYMTEFENPNKHERDDSKVWHVNDMRFCESWDWLVPVIVKFITIGVPKELTKDEEEDYQLQHSFRANSLNIENSYDLRLIFMNVVQAIDWYNSYNKK